MAKKLKTARWVGRTVISAVIQGLVFAVVEEAYDRQRKQGRKAASDD